MSKEKIYIKSEPASLKHEEQPLSAKSVKVKQEKAPALLPLAYSTSSLNAKYSIAFDEEDIVETYVPSKNIHAQLYAAEQGYRDKYGKLYASKSGKATLSAANIVTAELGFLYSDASLDEGYIGNLDFAHTPVRVPITAPQYTFNVTNFFDDTKSYEAAGVASNKGMRNSDFNAHLQRRIKEFGKYKIFDLSATTALTSARGFELQVQKDNFHETFHHSEQAVMEFFSGEEGKKFVVQRLQKLGAETVGGIILDMHSTRYLCGNCNVNVVGFQNTQKKGALYDITQQLHGKGVRIDTPEEGLLWSTRVSATETGRGTHSAPARKTTDDGHTHKLSYENRHLVLQGDSGKLGLAARADKKGYSLDTFSGDFFTSRELGKVKMESALDKRECLGK